MKTQIHTLDNGLKLVLVDTKAFPSLTSLLLIGAGSRYENKENNGIAHFFEHMAFKGSSKYPNAFQLSSIIEGLGGVFNAFTGKDYTGYYVKAPTPDFETVIDVLADMIQKPLLKKDEIEREKGVIVQEINMYEDTPQKKVFELYEELLYSGTPLGFDIAGNEKTISSFNRKTFTRYIDKLYHPNNSVLILAGGLTSETKLKLSDYTTIILEKFSQWKRGTVDTYKYITENQSKPGSLVKYKDSDQAHLCIGYRTFPRLDNRRYALGVLSAALGRGMSSRLFIEVRERRGLCYSIATLNESYDEVGNILTYAGVSTDKSKVKKTIELILKEHHNIMKNGITKKELIRAKQLLKGQLILSLEDTYNIAALYGKQLLLEKEHTSIKEILKKLDEVTLNDVHSVAQDLFKQESLNLSLIGPFKNETEFSTLLR